MSTYFKHLQVPDQWRQYWTKYPEGYTLLEALLNWVEQVNALTDNINIWDTYLDGFVESFDKNMQTKIQETLQEWKDSGFLADIINTEILGNKADVTYTSIKKYNNNLVTALQNESLILIPAGTFPTQPITRDLLAGKKIIGLGKKSILKFVGDVTPFDIDGLQDVFLSDFAIEVDATNTKDIILMETKNGETIRNQISSIWIDTVDKSQGQYTGLHILSNPNGVYQNKVSNLNIENCKNGIIIEAAVSGSSSWATHNLIESPYIRKYTGVAIGFIEAAGTSVINNHVAAPRILDFTMDAITRTAIKLDGRNNIISNVEMFNDGIAGTCVALDIKDIHVCYNNKVTGAMEGIIVNPHMLTANQISLTIVKRQNASTMVYMSKPYSYYQSTLTNLLDNSDFRKGLGLWYGVNAGLTLVNGATNGKAVQVALTAAGGKMQLDVPKPSYYASKTVTLTASVKSNIPLRITLSEGGTSFDFGTTVLNNGQEEIISVSRKLSGNELHLMIAADDAVGAVGNFTVNWVCLSEGVQVPIQNVAERAKFITAAKGQGTIAAGTASIVINHGLDVTPRPQDISITPLSWWNTATAELQYWITEVGAATFKVQMSKNAPAAWDFGWKADV